MPVGSQTTPTMEVMLSPVFPMSLLSLLAAHGLSPRPALWAYCSMWLTCLGRCTAEYHPLGSRHTLTYRYEVATPEAACARSPVSKSPLHHLTHECFTCPAQWHLTASSCPSDPGVEYTGLSCAQSNGQPRKCAGSAWIRQGPSS